ncbi:translation initiation factor 2 [Streptomyces sp. NPDC093510]|uniref:translation initiation factor 2 n=1 Tax=Streptomyces sp. NPDC093510 TaxID=3155199 RepID=UPI00344393AE
MNNPEAGSGQRAAGSGQRAAGSGQRAAGSGQRAAGSGPEGSGRVRHVLFAARSATALHRLLDVLPVFAGDDRVRRRFTLVPGSDFGTDALRAVERAGGRTIPWAEALARPHDLILAASPKGGLDGLRGPCVLLPHGAGYNKALREEEGSGDSASGMDPALLMPGGHPLARLHALAHPSQVARLAAECPPAAARATVTGDPTLDRVLASLPLRERYRAALRTHGRKLVVLTSTWGPHSLIRRHPGLPARLAAELPHDTYQLGLVLHPNEHSRTGEFDLAQDLAPALDAGLVLARPDEEWAALLIAADTVVTDHGSAALYAAAARDVPVLASGDGGGELIAGTPMAELLAHVPVLCPLDGTTTTDLERAVAAYVPGTSAALAERAFAERGAAVHRLREELYRLLGLTPRGTPAEPRLLPDPAPPARALAAFAVQVDLHGPHLHVERRPARSDAPAHHLAAEYGRASDTQSQSAGLLFRRAGPAVAGPARGETWTVDGWTRHVLAEYGGPRTAAVALTASYCVLRRTGGPLLSVRIEPHREPDGRVLRADPAAVLSGVHAWLTAHPDAPAHPVTIPCVVAARTHHATLTPATPEEGQQEIQGLS